MSSALNPTSRFVVMYSVRLQSQTIAKCPNQLLHNQPLVNPDNDQSKRTIKILSLFGVTLLL